MFDTDASEMLGTVALASIGVLAVGGGLGALYHWWQNRTGPDHTSTVPTEMWVGMGSGARTGGSVTVDEDEHAGILSYLSDTDLDSMSNVNPSFRSMALVIQIRRRIESLEQQLVRLQARLVQYPHKALAINNAINTTNAQIAHQRSLL